VVKYSEGRDESTFWYIKVYTIVSWFVWALSDIIFKLLIIKNLNEELLVGLKLILKARTPIPILQPEKRTTQSRGKAVTDTSLLL